MTQRPIKFRVWDSQIKEMLPWEDVLREFELGELFEGSGPYSYMQFTGLRDKNGKEIYEGDIVAWGKDGSKSVVQWDNDECGFRPYVNITTEVIGNIHENSNLLK